MITRRALRGFTPKSGYFMRQAACSCLYHLRGEILNSYLESKEDGESVTECDKDDKKGLLAIGKE